MTTVVFDALGQITEQGAVGAMLVLAILALAWIMRRTVVKQDGITERFINHLETKGAEQTEAMMTVSKGLEGVIRRQEDHERLAQRRHDAMLHEIETIRERLP